MTGLPSRSLFPLAVAALAVLAFAPARAEHAQRAWSVRADVEQPVPGAGTGEAVFAEDGQEPGTITPPAAEDRERHVVAARRGTTLIDLLTGAEVPHDEAAEAIGALGGLYDPRRLKIGEEVTVVFEPRRSGRRFVGLELAPDPARQVTVSRAEAGGFIPAETVKAIERHPTALTGAIKSSLFESGQAAGVPVPVMMEMIRLFSHEVDFQRDLQPGDRFSVFYETKRTGDGAAVGIGDVLFASLVLSGKELSLYRYTHRDGRTDHYDRDGESVRRSLLRTPVEGARLTSGFGMRRHPILGYSKAHKGLDFGAPTGTPIFAAGRGVIEEIGRNGSYGNYIRIRHDIETATAYAHMSRFERGLDRGARVEQGEVIGFVGTTGRSTGPHLHYEVMRQGRQVDPRSLNLPTGEKLHGPVLDAFQVAAKAIDRAFTEALAGSMSMVSAPGPLAKPSRACTGGAGC
jgi:murein DD-endopeptidase MepM/ murein hydrolase activator NlpD